MAGALTRARTACLAVLFWAVAGSVHADVFYPSNFTLSNGLQVVVVPHNLSPVVSQMVWYKVGAADEAAGKTGLAHYLEHLMFRGTENVPAGEFSTIIAAQGGHDNAFTSRDYTAYYEEVAADRLPMIMQMEADRMQNLRIVPETATPELHVVLDERQERTDNSPEGRFLEALDRKFMPGHPYGRPVIGWMKDVAKLSPADARAFYETYYAPNNAVVVISGDVRVEDVMRLAAATYGRVPRRDVPERGVFKPAPRPALRRWTMRDARVEQPEILWRFAAPSYATQKGNEAYALEVLGEVLDSGEVGLLYRKLVTEQRLAVSADAGYDPDARGETRFSLGVSPRAGVAPSKLDKALRDVLREAARQGLDPAQVESAKQRLQRAALFAREGLTAPGHAFGMGLMTGHTVADVEAWPDRISAVTVADVNAALRGLLAEKRQITGMLLPAAAQRGGRR